MYCWHLETGIRCTEFILYTVSHHRLLSSQHFGVRDNFNLILVSHALHIILCFTPHHFQNYYLLHFSSFMAWLPSTWIAMTSLGGFLLYLSVNPTNSSQIIYYVGSLNSLLPSSQESILWATKLIEGVFMQEWNKYFQ
jgi:hypothetical protein